MSTRLEFRERTSDVHSVPKSLSCNSLMMFWSPCGIRMGHPLANNAWLGNRYETIGVLNFGHYMYLWYEHTFQATNIRGFQYSVWAKIEHEDYHTVLLPCRCSSETMRPLAIPIMYQYVSIRINNSSRIDRFWQSINKVSIMHQYVSIKYVSSINAYQWWNGSKLSLQNVVFEGSRINTYQ